MEVVQWLHHVVISSPSLHVKFVPCRRETVAVSGPRWSAVNCPGEVCPDLGDGVETLKVSENFIIVIKARVHIKPIPHRCEAVKVSWARRASSSVTREVRPKLCYGVEDV